MTSIIAYRTPQQFLDGTEKLLEERELENNLILGICNGFADKNKLPEGCVFINTVDGNQIQASSIKTIAKAIVGGTTRNPQHIKALADHYRDNGVDLKGVVGESFYSSEFSKFYNKRQIGGRTMLVHKLITVNNLPLVTGKLDCANAEDIDLLTEWALNFQVDARIFPKQSREQVSTRMQSLIGLNDIFKWVDKGEIVSTAAIVRKTKNLGIVGLVYTPEKWRGKGYATSSVQKLSGYILQKGFKYCGLFTDKSNPTSNHIYKKIGYEPVTEFTDIEFG